MCRLVGYIADTVRLLNDKVIRLASGENLMLDVIQPSARLCTGDYNIVNNNARGVYLNVNSTQKSK